MSDAAHLEAALAALALRLRREVAVMQALRSPERRDQFLGLFLTDEDAAALCDEIAGRVAEVDDDGLDDCIAAMEQTVAGDRAEDAGLTINRLAAVFGLSGLECELLVLAAAPAIDPRFGLVYGYLADDLARRALTPALAQRVWADRGLSLPDVRAALGPAGPLRRYALLTAQPGDQPLAATAMQVPERVLDLLMGCDRADPALAALLIDDAVPPDIAALAPLQPIGLDRPIVLLAGNKADPVLAAAALAGREGLGVRRLDWGRWATVAVGDLPQRLAAALRDTRLAGAVPLVTGWEDAPGGPRTLLAGALEAPALVAAPGPAWREVGLVAAELRVPPAPRVARSALLAAAIAPHLPDGAATLAEELSQAYHVPAADIGPLVDVAALAPPPFAEALRATFRRHAGRPLADLAERVDTPHDFSALVLPPAPLAALHDLVGTRATGATVLDDWGLGFAFNRRPGAVALFAGPSGTGKTMAAGVVARALALDLYRIDLSGVVSKYIGETERNLERIFAAAERSSAVLFFDEADALFGKRSEVQDAHDRYANIEVSYLLQRIEQFDGVAILASNLKQNLDEAFLRRIDLVIDFPAPQVAERRGLWLRLAGTDAPIADDVDFALLAERFELTGGAIRNCALAAAHAAARDGTAIHMRHLVAAIAREYVKLGQPVRKVLFGDLHAVPSDPGRVA